MSLPITEKRCTARLAADPCLPRCPRRLECERYVAYVALEVGETAPTERHLCRTEAYEFRIEPMYGEDLV